LPSHEIPLPPSDDEGGDARSSTLPLGSGSTQEWAATQLCGGGRVETPWTYTSRLMQALHQRGTETITRGVQRLHVDEGDEAAAEEARGCDNVDGDGDCNSDDLPDIRPLGRKATKGGATARKGPAAKSRRNKKMDDDTGRSNGEGGRNFWSVGDTIALVRARRDQDLYIAGMGTSFARMKTREWKWEDVRARLQSMGVTRDVVDCGKKWDNLMQQFKKVHKFQNLSGGKDYFKLASKERRSEGFSFVMDRSVYDEMEAMTEGDHTIHPKNLADTGAAGGVQMPAGAGAAGDTMGSEGGGDAVDEEQGSTRDSTFSAGSGGGYGKRKNMRQQTIEVVADVMDKHDALMASTMDSASKRQCSMMSRQCDILESEVEVQRKHYAAADEANKMMSEALMEIAKAIRERS
ncbi:hypothetical protein CBR_g70975, partial [Chara braunii]